jgi:hypothetical protein
LPRKAVGCIRCTILLPHAILQSGVPASAGKTVAEESRRVHSMHHFSAACHTRSRRVHSMHHSSAARHTPIGSPGFRR